MSKLGTYRASRSLAKIALEEGLRIVNDFYWGILASTKFSCSSSIDAALLGFISGEQIFEQQGRLRPANVPNLIRESEKELPSFAVLLLFSYFEPYLRKLWLSALLGNLGILNASPGSVDGEAIASNSSLRASISQLCVFRVEPLLKGTYADRFAKARKLFAVPKAITDPHLATLDEYYAKRNCLVHFQGQVDDRAKKHFQTDSRNQVGGRVVIEHSDFLRLHRAMHLASDDLDAFIVQNHIGNTEVFRLLFELRDTHPGWAAKDFTREMLLMKLPERLSRNVVAELLGVRKK